MLSRGKTVVECVEGAELRSENNKSSKKSNKVSIDMELIAGYLKGTKQNARKSSPDDTNTPRAKKMRVAKVTPPKTSSADDVEEEDVSIPVPANTDTMIYTKPEAVRILAETKKKTTQRRVMMDKMIRLGWAPTSPRALQRLLKIHEEGGLVLDDGWSGNGHQGGGRRRALTSNDIDKLVGRWRRGEAHGMDSIKNAIVEAKADLIKRSGGVPLNVSASVGRTTNANYATTIANHAGVSIVNKATGKGKHRAVAERSHRRIACLIGMMGSTYLQSVPEEDLDIREELKNLPEHCRVLYDIVSEARGTAVYPIKPHNNWSIDDSTAYTFAGTSNLNDKVKLVTKESVKASGSDSIWQLDESNSMKGMRVCMTFAFSAAGTCLPAVVCVSGLTEHELPVTDFLHLEVPGFCIGGGANVTAEGVGHFLFMRDTPGAKQEKFKWYQKHVFVPGVNATRMEFDEFDATAWTEIPVKETAVVACDGDIPQLKAMLEELELYDENGIIFNKLNPAASATEQSADRNPIFKLIKEKLPSHTVRNIPPERCPMKRRVHKAFKSDKLSGLKLSHTKTEALIDFIAVFPGILSQTCTPDNI